MIDLRSDTKTRPSVAMREAIARAEVGDDVTGDDPTTNELQDYCAELSGKEAALLVTSGTLGNLVSIYARTSPGQELVCHEQAHIYHYERGGFAAVCGLLARPLPGLYGTIAPETLAEALYDGTDVHRQPTGLICLENTHNNCGGTCLNTPQTNAVADIAKEHGVGLHIDGARIFNAAVALGVSARELAAPAESITFCFSKGLGAPIGSMVCGSRDFIKKAREARKLFGGGMRQAGIVAAAARYALENNIARLADDHANARRIAETLAQCPGIEIDLGSVQTNIIYFRVQREDMTAPQLCSRMAEYGVACSARDDHLIRFVTHLDVSSEDTTVVCEALAAILQ